jgi:ubiquinone biosynthesis accessory factor UbiJ
MTSGINPTVHTALLAALETAVNRALELSPGAREELATLEGQVFALHCTAPQVDVFLAPTAQGLRLMGIFEDKATTSVTGTASDFAELATATDPAATLINGNLEINGDSAPLIELQGLISSLDIDWEAPLVDALGDVGGHQLAQLLRGTFSWGKQASSGLLRQIGEYIHEEGRLSPPRDELEDFYRDVHELEMRVERLQSRAQRLVRRLKQLT